MDFDEFMYGASDEQLKIIESLIHQVHLDKQQQMKVDIFLSQTPTMLEADEFIHYLNSLIVDPISSGKNYSQTDIQNKLRDEID